MRRPLQPETTAGDGYIHVLVEHQSTPDKHMAFRLIRYAVAAMQRHLKAGHNKTTTGDTGAVLYR